MAGAACCHARVNLCYHVTARASRSIAARKRNWESRPFQENNGFPTCRRCRNSILTISNAACRRAQATLKHELGGLRTGRASASLLEPVQVEAYGQRMPINQLATISVPEPRALSVSVWDKAMVHAVDKAIRDANLGLSPTVEGTTLRIRIPELNEQRRKEMVKVAHKYCRGRAGRGPPRAPRRPRRAQATAQRPRHRRGRREAPRGRSAEGDRSRRSPRSTPCSRPRKRKSCRSSRVGKAEAAAHVDPRSN